MNLNNIFKKVTGVALAATLSFGAFAGSAFAAQTSNSNVPAEASGSGNFTSSVPDVNKTVNVPDTTGYFAGGDFTFKIARGDQEGYSYSGWRTPNFPETGDLITVNDEFSVNVGASSAVGTDASGSKKLDVAQTVPDGFLPGVYRYTITENDPQMSGMKQDTRTFNIDVFVQRNENNELDITNYIVSVPDANNSLVKSNIDFNNELNQNQISVTKTITGNQVNYTDKFDFTVKLTKHDKNESVRIIYGNDTHYLNSSNNYQVTLQDLTNESNFVIYGLDDADEISITEAEDGDNIVKNYVSTYKINDGEAQEGPTANGVKGDSVKVEFINTINQDVPTGLIENIAPFILAIAAAGIVFFVYFKRDKEEELA